MALDNVCLSVESGSCFGLLGPNGAGKTSLVSILTGLLDFSVGRIAIDGLDFSCERKAIQHQSALVPQEYAFYPKLSVLENLIFFGGVLGLRGSDLKRRIEECIGFCQLESVCSRRATTFSGGLKRRLNLAIGLLGSPKLLYLDEPTVGIDPQSRQFILERIQELNSNGTTIIYTSHYMEEVEKLCDSMAIIDHGKVLIQGKKHQLLRDCHPQLVMEFTDKLDDDFMAGLHQLLPNPERLGLNDRVLRYDGELNSAQLASIHTLVSSQNLSLLRSEYGELGLEQLFLSLTKKALRD